ncbi:uncharacterized protein LOC114323635 [Camellia sinensis]|uniref:uncharacterized protein LOC114323635 n=1 Tax=Camellia sinensis TaxID=4442 RepID=UPI00103675A5|nr:uncharacterized protein LOC114323635 [Camellia sinensis]
MNQPTSMGQLMQRINKHIRVEDDAAASTAKTNPVATDKRVAGKIHEVAQETNHPNDRVGESNRGPNRRNRGKGRRNDRAEHPRDDAADANRKLNARMGITTVFKIPIYRILSEIRDEDYVRFFARLGDAQKGFNPRYRCTFHGERGHRTEDCLPLKQHLEELVEVGHLDLYIDGGVRAAHSTPADPSGSDDLEAPPQGVVNVIHGIVELARGKTEEKDVISFSTRDLERIQTPHNNALVVTLRVRDFDVKRILIDQGSSVEIMYYDAFKQLKLQDTDLAPATLPLVGFNSQSEWSMGKIILLVKAGSFVKQVEFWILKVPSTYNLILGKGWLHAMQAVTSTYHQVMRFPSAMGEVEEIWGDQVMLKQCFVVVNGSRAAKGFVQMIEGLEDQGVLDDVGAKAEDKAIEELVEVRIDTKSLNKFFLLRSSLTAQERTEMVDFFMANIEVFA